MPNWCEGTLKIRGKKEDLDQFFRESLEPCSGIHEDDPDYFFNIDTHNEEYTSIDIFNLTYINGTKRAFSLPWNIEYSSNNVAITIAIPFQQAWDIETDDWEIISEAYDLDVRIYAFECGMEFCREIEILNGIVTIDNTITYKDWLWECPCPNMGG